MCNSIVSFNSSISIHMFYGVANCLESQWNEKWLLEFVFGYIFFWHIETKTFMSKDDEGIPYET